MSYKICGGNVVAATVTLEAARGFVEYELGRHPDAVAGPFGIVPTIEWAWNLEVLECRSGESGAVLFTIRPMADP